MPPAMVRELLIEDCKLKLPRVDPRIKPKDRFRNSTSTHPRLAVELSLMTAHTAQGCTARLWCNLSRCEKRLLWLLLWPRRTPRRLAFAKRRTRLSRLGDQCPR